MPKTSSSVLKLSIKHILYAFNQDIYSGKKSDLNILIALSGGQDSTCLTFFIIIYQKLLSNDRRVRVGIIHCQHYWDTVSLNKANYIDSWLSLLRQLNMNVTLYSSIPSNPTVTEAESREWRLKVFTRIAKKYKYNFILTGHTLNDEVETFLMQQIIRGFFSPGTVFNQDLYKPLIWVHRNEILRICKYWQLPLFADSTNTSLLLPRSRIRLELFSILKAFYNPQIENNLKQTIQIQKETSNSIKENELSIHLFCKNNRIVLNRLKLNKLPLIKQRNLWRHSFEALGVFNLGFYWIEKSIFYSQTKKQFIFYLIKNIKLEGSGKYLILSKNQN